MWLHDPYVVEQWLRRHAEQTARAQRRTAAGAAATATGSRLPERAVLALRVLTDAALAARVRQTVAPRAPGTQTPVGAPSSPAGTA